MSTLDFFNAAVALIFYLSCLKGPNFPKIAKIFKFEAS